MQSILYSQTVQLVMKVICSELPWNLLCVCLTSKKWQR